MHERHEDLSETHILGEKTRQMVVRVSEEDTRAWLADSAVCEGLGQHGIAHLGICDAQAPYRIVRMKQSGAYFMACLKGEGRILADGRWLVCRAGMACLLPPHMVNAFYALPGKKWEFAWVRYQAVAEKRLLVTSNSPVMAKYSGDPLRYAILGLHSEMGGTAHPTAVHHWVEQIQTQVVQFARPWQVDSRLAQLWEQVEPRLGESWTLEGMAALAHVSGEHLRRLCMQQLGRPPMRHLTWLRMRAAAEMLAASDEKVETVATMVGYANPFVFSNTFKKWIGWRPSEHRLKGEGRSI